MVCWLPTYAYGVHLHCSGGEGQGRVRRMLMLTCIGMPENSQRGGTIRTRFEKHRRRRRGSRVRKSLPLPVSWMIEPTRRTRMWPRRTKRSTDPNYPVYPDREIHQDLQFRQSRICNYDKVPTYILLLLAFSTNNYQKMPSKTQEHPERTPKSSTAKIYERIEPRDGN